MQYNGIIRAFCLPMGLVKFFSALGDRKIAGLWFARGVSTQTGTMHVKEMIDLSSNIRGVYYFQLNKRTPSKVVVLYKNESEMGKNR